MKYLFLFHKGVSKRKAPTPEFSWLKPYLGGTSSNSSKQVSPSGGDHNQNSQIFTIDGGNACAVTDLLGIAGDEETPRIESDGGSVRSGGDGVSVRSGSDGVSVRSGSDGESVRSEGDRHRAVQESSVEVGVDVAANVQTNLPDDVDSLRVSDVTLEPNATSQSTFYVRSISNSVFVFLSPIYRYYFYVSFR